MPVTSQQRLKQKKERLEHSPLRFFFSYRASTRLTFVGWIVVLFFFVLILVLSRGILVSWINSYLTADGASGSIDAVVFESWGYPQRFVLNDVFVIQRNRPDASIYFTEYLPSDLTTATDAEVPRYYHQMLDLYFQSEGIDASKVLRIPVEMREPVTLNTARTVVDTLHRRGCKSFVLVSPWYHSNRSFKVYRNYASEKGIIVYCKPSEGGITRSNWWTTHAGLSTVLGEVVKSIFYVFKQT